MNQETGFQTNAAQPDKPLWRRILGLPGTRTGWWSLWLIMASLFFFGLFWALVASGQRGGETFFSNPWLTFPMLAAAGSAIAAGGTAAVAIFWQRERSAFGFIALLFGLLVLVFAIGEVAFPH